MRQLPRGVTAYKKTQIFTETNLPKALRSAHATKAGVWGLIHITSGRLRYDITETAETFEFGPNDPPAVIEPEIRHSVTPLGCVNFCVEFFR